MRSGEGNKGNLQYLTGEFLNAWAFANIQAQGDSEIMDKGVHTLDAFAYPVTRDDDAFKREWNALNVPDKGHVDLRYEQMRLLIAKLYDAKILSDKAIPFYGEADDAE